MDLNRAVDSQGEERPRTGPPATHSPVTGEPCPSYYIHANSAHFRDTYGRTLLLRGVNVTGSAKTPRGQPQQKLEGFWEGAESGDVSFVDRVFDLGAGGHDTDVHLRRLKAWGFNTLRYIFTWEAIEHKGPGIYDQEFIEYTIRMLRKIKSFGFRVFMDPHQDLFSRFSGGCGAPYWALLACGMNPRNFSATNAAMIQCEWPTPENPDPENFPDMIWASNYTRLAAMTLFTFFFAGRDYAPKCVIDGVNIQDWLTTKFFAAVTELATAIDRAGGLYDVCVIGWDSLNEPNEGFVGTPDLRKHRAEGAGILRIGPTPNGIEAMRLGMGEKLTVENWRFGPLGPKKDGSVTIDPQGRRAWLDADVEDAEGRHPRYGWKRSPEWKLGSCIWAQHGVWDIKTGRVLKPQYFDRLPGTDQKVSFTSDYWRAHYIEYAKMIRRAHREAILFILPPVFQVPPKINELKELLSGRACHSAHFYDGLTLITKHWNWFNADAVGMLRGKYRSVLQAVRIGEANIRKCLRQQLGVLRQDTFDAVGQYPTMFSEIGIPFDLDKKQAYQTGDYHNQVRALDASLNACDGDNVLNYTTWVYTPDNSHRWGDGWNTEDLSIWSADDAHRTSKARKAKPYRTLSQHYQYSGQRLGPIRSLLDTVAPRKSESKTALTEDNSPVSQVSSVTSEGQTFGGIRPNASMRTLLSPPSQLSLAAGSAVSSDDGDDIEETGPETVSYIEINDGARGLPAFVRPYPMRTVGTPVFINFDIQSSEFTLTVEVRHDDLAPGASVPTEIYLPLVHYAAAPKAVARAVREDTEDAEASDSPESSTNGNGLSDSLGSSTLVGEALKPPVGGELDKPSKVLIKEDANDMMAPSALDIDVQVSEGAWTIQSQLLKWTYPIPPSAGHGVYTYRLRVVRKSGPIQTWTKQLGEELSAPWHDFLDCSKWCTIS